MNVPSELKPIAPYLQRAKEIKTKSAVVAYFCLTYAVKRGIEIKSLTSESRSFLSDLMDKVEKERESLRESPELASDIEGKNIMLRTANDVFQYADKQEKAGVWTKAIAQAFLAASNFYEVTKLFGDQLEEEYEQKIKYARFKAADVNTAIKTGRQPESGKGPQKYATDDQVVERSATQLEPYIPPNPSAPTSFNSHSPQNHPSPHSHPTTPIAFTSPKVEPPYNHPQFQPPNPNPYPQPISPHSFPAPPPAHHYHPNPPPQQNPYYPPPNSAPPAHVIAKSTKHARHAISALQFDDVATAIANLQASINELMPYHH